MEKRRLGRTELEVSVIGMGGIPIQRIDKEEAVTVLEVAISTGINFFDTARGYSDSEDKFGLVLGPRHEEVIVATKSMARTKDGMMADIDISLKNLQLKYIDLYQLHNVRTKEELAKVLAPDGALAALREAQAAGKVKHVGITGHVLDVLVSAVSTGEFETVQFPFNAVEQEAATTLLPLAEKLDIGVIVMKPLAGGALASAELALRFFNDYNVSTIIPGMDSVEQVKANAKLGQELIPLTDKERKSLQIEISRLGSRFCRRCEYCLPCPEGIRIPLVFTFDGYWTRYGLKEWATERYAEMAVKASACAECGICESRCPYNLPIREMLKEAAEHFGS
ncbi:MAG: aldo/keto reductase [bacterium]|jgi:predicted aldo/keto reductase-like oxidoreductase